MKKLFVLLMSVLFFNGCASTAKLDKRVPQNQQSTDILACKLEKPVALKIENFESIVGKQIELDEKHLNGVINDVLLRKNSTATLVWKNNEVIMVNETAGNLSYSNEDFSENGRLTLQKDGSYKGAITTKKSYKSDVTCALTPLQNSN